MKIYMIDSNRIAAYYEAEEIQADTVKEFLARRDFIKNYEVADETDELNEKAIAMTDEGLEEDQHRAEVVDEILNLGWWIQIINDKLKVANDRIIFEFNNWSEIEYWLQSMEGEN